MWSREPSVETASTEGPFYLFSIAVFALRNAPGTQCPGDMQVSYARRYRISKSDSSPAAGRSPAKGRCSGCFGRSTRNGKPAARGGGRASSPRNGRSRERRLRPCSIHARLARDLSSGPAALHFPRGGTATGRHLDDLWRRFLQQGSVQASFLSCQRLLSMAPDRFGDAADLVVHRRGAQVGRMRVWLCTSAHRAAFGAIQTLAARHNYIVGRWDLLRRGRCPDAQHFSCARRPSSSLAAHGALAPSDAG